MPSIPVLPLAIRDGLVLEPYAAEHVDALFSLVERDRPYLAQWTTWAEAMRSRSEMSRLIERSIVQRAKGTSIVFAIVERGDVVGTIGLHVQPEHHRAYIGYWLGEREQGRGIMTDACRAVTKFGLETLALHRIEILCATGNERSRRIPERLGYTEEAVLHGWLRQCGRYHDVVVYVRFGAERR